MTDRLIDWLSLASRCVAMQAETCVPSNHCCSVHGLLMHGARCLMCVLGAFCRLTVTTQRHERRFDDRILNILQTDRRTVCAVSTVGTIPIIPHDTHVSYMWQQIWHICDKFM